MIGGVRPVPTAGRRICGGLLLAAVVLVFGLAPPAAAGVEGGCWGTATIDGVTYDPTYDTRGNPIVVPLDEDGVLIPWIGNVDFGNENHSGKIKLVIGPGEVEIADWSGPNPDDDRDADGVYELDDAKDVIPFGLTGIYEVKGEHSADGGMCKGSVFVKLSGNPLATPIGIVSVAGTLLTLAGIAVAGMPGKGKA